MRFPLAFNSGAHTQSSFRSQHFNIAPLVAPQPLHPVHLHKDGAEARGIGDGDEVVVSSPRGAVRFWAHVTDNILAGVVEVNMGDGGPLDTESWQQATANALTDIANIDSMSGFPVYKALLCQVTKA